MKIIEQSYEILKIDDNILQMIEKAGRTCYKSEDKITEDSATKFVKMLNDNGHKAMIEFGDIIVKFITNRGVTHELVRHRMCSFAQESTRYVKYDGEMEFIKPVWSNNLNDSHCQQAVNILKADHLWLRSMFNSEKYYKQLLEDGWRPEQAREILPNSLKTEIVVKANIREWQHLLTLRCSKKAHPQIRALMIPLLEELKTKIPVVFDNIDY